MWLRAALLNGIDTEYLSLIKVFVGLLCLSKYLLGCFSPPRSSLRPLLHFYYFRYILSLLATPHWPFWKWGCVFTQHLLTNTMHREMRHTELKSECYSMFDNIQQLSPCTHSAYWVPNYHPTDDGERPWATCRHISDQGLLWACNLSGLIFHHGVAYTLGIFVQSELTATWEQ